MLDFGLSHGHLVLLGFASLTLVMAIPLLPFLKDFVLSRKGASALSIFMSCFFLFAAIKAGGEKTNGLMRTMPLDFGVAHRIESVSGIAMRKSLANLRSQSPSRTEKWVGRWNTRGAFDDSFRCEFEDGFVFPEGTNHLSGVEILSSGEIWRTPFDTNSVASIGIPVSIVPGVTTFGIEHSPSNSYLISWTNAAVNRSTNELTTASIELFRNGDIAVTTNGVFTYTERELPFPHVGFGQDAEWVAASFTNATEILAMGYTNWVDEAVGDTTNGLYKFVVSFQEAPPEIVNVTIGDLSVAVAEAGDYPLVLAKGVCYNIHFSYLPEGVTCSWDDGVVDPPPMRDQHSLQMRMQGYVNNPRYAVRLVSHGDDGHGLEFESPREDGDGFVVWWPWLLLSPSEEVDPAFPVVLNASVFDIPERSVASVTWSANDEVLTTGETFIWQGDANNITSICVTAQFADIELVGEFQIECHVRESDIAILGGGLIVVEDSYTNAPGDVVSASSSSTDLQLSWWLAEEGTLALTTDCGAFVRAATNNGSAVSLPMQWRGGGDEENELSISLTGLGAPTNGTFSFSFTPDEGGSPVVRTVPLQIVKVRVEALADWPSNRVRHVFGVNERFKVFAEPGGLLLETNAPPRIGTHGIPLTFHGSSHIIDIESVPPSSDIHYSWQRSMSNIDWMQLGLYVLQPGDGVPGVGFIAKTMLTPEYVSFRDIYFMEGYAEMSDQTGCFSDASIYPPAIYSHHQGAGAYRPVQVSGAGNIVEGYDLIGVQISPPQTTDASFALHIPIYWGIDAMSCSNRFSTTHQVVNAYTNGLVRVTKGTAYEERNCLNGYSNHN